MQINALLLAEPLKGGCLWIECPSKVRIDSDSTVLLGANKKYLTPSLTHILTHKDSGPVPKLKLPAQFKSISPKNLF